MKSSKVPRREGRYNLSVAHLLIALVAMFVVMPFVDRWRYGAVAEAIAFTVVLLASVNAISGRRRTQLAAILMVAPVLMMRWVYHIWPHVLPVEPSTIAAIVFVMFVVFHLFRYVITAQVVDSEVLYAAVSVYLLIGVAWAFFYTLVARIEPNAFVSTVAAEPEIAMRGFTALHFSMEILTTIAYGDILPVSNVARMLTLVEAVVGVFYVTILIARLVSLHTHNPPRQDSVE